MKQLLTLSFLFVAFSVSAQKEFFKSTQKFSDSHLENFYSSLSLHDSLVFFKANDYSLYTYNKNTGELIWKYYMKYKSNTAPHVAGNYIWTNLGETEGLRLGMDGAGARSLPFSVYSKPYFNNNILYTTGIYDAGNVLAYDVNADSILWYRFIAHGCDRLPYYLNDRIIANAEGNEWIELDYNGYYLNKDCSTEKNEFPDENCRKEFMIRTHDNKFMSADDAGKIGMSEWSDKDVIFTNDRTIILEAGNLYVIGKKKKKKNHIVLNDLSEDINIDNYGFCKLLKADDKSIWIIYSEKLLKLDGEGKKLEKLVDLENWNPHQAVMDGNNIWLINRNDGLLYGLSVD